MRSNVEQHAQGLLKWLYKNPDEAESACIARYVETHHLDADFGDRLVGFLQSCGMTGKEPVPAALDISTRLGRHRLGSAQQQPA